MVNINLEKILVFWLGKDINSHEIGKFLIPLSISAFSISLFNSLKILFIAENKISLMKKPLILILYLFIFLTVLIYMKFLTVEVYLYYLSISKFVLMTYFYLNFFQENIFNLIMISIILATQNNEQTIFSTIKSILNQSYNNFELIIINDFSTDKTKQIIQSFNDNRIIYIENQKNIGRSKSRNLGIKKAKGEFIAIMDGDDIAIEYKLEKN